MADPVEPPAEIVYKDDDLVYVDPDLRVVVGIVQWGPNERPKSLSPENAPTEKEAEDEGKPERRRRRKFFPWGTYRSMKRIYKLEGKIRDEKPMLQLDEAIGKAMAEPFWD